MRLAITLSASVLVAACATEKPAAPGLLDLSERPAENALMIGMRAYEDGQYAESEKQLRSALSRGLASPRDRAGAEKYLAFIYCTSNRIDECEAAFRAARKADPSFALGKSEAGHPVWGPVYKRLQ